MDKKLPKLLWGLKKDNGELVNIKNVESGLNCNCICPDENCQKQLIAKNKSFEGRKFQFFFAHEDGTDNIKCNEAAIHKLAKKILQEIKEIKLPKVESRNIYIKDVFKENELLKFKGFEKEKLFETTEVESKNIKLKEIKLEFENIEFIKQYEKRPDIIASVEDKKNELIIEIKNTNEVNEDKKKLFKIHKLYCIEVDVKDINPQDEVELLSLFKEDSNNRIKWINFPYTEEKISKTIKNPSNEIKERLEEYKHLVRLNEWKKERNLKTKELIDQFNEISRKQEKLIEEKSEISRKINEVNKQYFTVYYNEDGFIDEKKLRMKIN